MGRESTGPLAALPASSRLADGGGVLRTITACSSSRLQARERVDEARRAVRAQSGTGLPGVCCHRAEIVALRGEGHSGAGARQAWEELQRYQLTVAEWVLSDRRDRMRMGICPRPRKRSGVRTSSYGPSGILSSDREGDRAARVFPEARARNKARSSARTSLTGVEVALAFRIVIAQHTSTGWTRSQRPGTGDEASRRRRAALRCRRGTAGGGHAAIGTASMGRARRAIETRERGTDGRRVPCARGAAAAGRDAGGPHVFESWARAVMHARVEAQLGDAVAGPESIRAGHR